MNPLLNYGQSDYSRQRKANPSTSSSHAVDDDDISISTLEGSMQEGLDDGGHTLSCSLELMSDVEGMCACYIVLPLLKEAG